MPEDDAAASTAESAEKDSVQIAEAREPRRKVQRWHPEGMEKRRMTVPVEDAVANSDPELVTDRDEGVCVVDGGGVGYLSNCSVATGVLCASIWLIRRSAMQS